MCKSASLLTSPDKYDVVISGGGPAALASAWEAIQNKKSVLMVMDRKMEFMRVQRVSLFSANKQYLLNMLKIDGRMREFITPTDNEDIKFIIELIQSATLAVKDIERFLKRRLLEFKKITYLEKSEIASVYMNKGIITVVSKEEKQQEKQIQFDYLIGADGIKHHAADIVNREEKRIIYSPIAQPAHPFHASVNVSLERKDTKPLQLPEQQFLITTHTSGWRLALDILCSPLYPAWGLIFDKSSKSFDGKKVKCMFGGEIPEELFESIVKYNKSTLNQAEKKDVEDKVMTHINNTIKIRLNQAAELKLGMIKRSEKHGAKKDTLKLQAFKTEFVRANVAALEIDKRKFILVGDAYTSPNYQLGNGMNHAFKHARKLGDVFMGTKSLDQYNNECKSLSVDIESKTNYENSRFLRWLAGPIAESTIEKDRKEFLKRHEVLLKHLISLIVQQKIALKG